MPDVIVIGGGPTGLMLAGELALGGVDVAVADGQTLRARYIVGADGGRSVIRKAAGIPFPGSEATRSNLIAEVELEQTPPTDFVQNESGVHGLQLLADGRTYRVVTTE